MGSTGIGADYTPVADDVGDYLRVVATYDDGRGGGKTAAAVSEYQTIARISSNTAPEFSAATATRVVLEGADAGTSIGNPMMATDGNSGERLTYWLNGTDAARFNIDAMTGQLKVKDNLNYETPVTDDGTVACANDACEVIVHVADSSGSVTDTIEVTISVIAVDEEPTFSTGLTTIVLAEDMTALSATVADFTYTASDPEEGSVTLSLSGADASKFELNDPDDAATLPNYSKELAFEDKPDLEMPGDSDRDNVYQVTVVASDGVNSAMREVTVKVTDMAEDGEIGVTPQQPRVGTELTATLTDSDGVMVPSWKWRKAMTADACSTVDDWTPDTTLIEDAESATYTPVADDDGYCLRVEASYLDMDYDDTMLFAKSVDLVLGGKVQGSSTNMAPMFADTRAMRYVPEDAMADTNVGMPVAAKDTDTLEYTLGGADKDLFTIVQADNADTAEVDEEGQIQVKDGDMLDHEIRPTLTVTVTATDPRLATDTITVTINVTDVDEAPMAVGSDDRTVEYTENDSSSVLTLSAMDPEGAAPIIWSLPTANADPDDGGPLGAPDTVDNGGFKISQSGVLTFAMKPDYDDPADAGDNNVYNVVVQASDGNMPSFFKVTVNVEDKEEEGSVKLQPTGQTAATTLLQPQVEVRITAHSLTDPDGNASTARGNDDIDESSATWQWYRSSSKTATGTAISSSTVGSTGIGADYTPVADDVGGYLRVVATYDDGRGGGKTAAAVSEYTTISAITSNTAPEFSAATATRVVLEGADAGTSIGNPMMATDGNSGERLTYWLNGTDAARFNIDAMTGQLKVKDNLNYETPVTDDGTVACANDACEVIVHVADSSGSVTDTIEVTISVIAVDEEPTFSTGLTTIVLAEDMTALSATVADFTYTASDPEEGSVTLSLSGADASKFELNDPDDAATLPNYSKELAFEDKPDFEMPGDSDRDNVYQVTVVASDGVNSAMREVTVKVTDMAEDGEIGVTPQQPRVGTELTATLTDSDGVMVPSWKWRKAMTADACSTVDDWTPDTTLIEDAESATYTPVADDDGYCLRVEASYLDMDYDDTMLFAKSVDLVLGGKVQGSSTNMAPMFADTRAMRYVPEDAMADTNVGMPVAAKDTDTLEYTLGGADKDLFTIVQADNADTAEVDEEGQIQVKDGDMLDHEIRPTLTVTVTATDPRLATDTITVTVNVTDVDEAPEIMRVDPGQGLTIIGIDSRSYAENGRGSVATYTTTGMVGSVTWTLGGDDMDAFDISSRGSLTFKMSPDYEMPTDMNTNNVYMVTVMASDGTSMDEHDVMVTVTDVVGDEMVEPPPDTTVPAGLQRFDTDGTPGISRAEVSAAVTEWITDDNSGISRRDIADLVNYWILGG